MTTDQSSPKRRHILSSFNPEEWHFTPPETVETPTAETHVTEGSPQPTTEESAGAEHAERKTTRFRFKAKRSHSHRERGDDSDRGHERVSPHHSSRRREGSRDDEDSSSRHHHHRRHHHRHKRRRSRSPTPPNPYESPPLDAEAAFRESLFDAMADDEGAAYWESVYGQPIHVYSNVKSGPQGELEQMNDDEYAAYVRQKMWEKTNQGLLEERARREERRKQKEAKETEARRLTRDMEEGLRRGEERRRRKTWQESWKSYAQAWSEWDGSLDTIPWPVKRSQQADVNSANVRDFFINGLDPLHVGEAEFLAKLREERVRWHPDKIQQKLGGKVDEKTMRDVTAVFQIIDKLWSDTRSKMK